MIAYHINSKEDEVIFLKTVTDAINGDSDQTECECPLCKVGKIEIIQSSRLKNYMCAICNSCGAGAFN